MKEGKLGFFRRKEQPIPKDHSINAVFQHEIDGGASQLGIIAETVKDKPVLKVISVREWAGHFSRSGNGRWSQDAWAPNRNEIIEGVRVIRIRPQEFEASQTGPSGFRPMVDWNFVDIAKKTQWFWSKPQS